MADNFQFVNVNHPSETKNKKNQHIIRAHAIRAVLQKDKTGKRTAKRCEGALDPGSDSVLSFRKLDPFDSLPHCPERLRALTRHKNAKQAGEPIFCVSDTGVAPFQGLESVLKGALADQTLFHAISLSLSLAANDGMTNAECLMHRGEVLKGIAENLPFGEDSQAIQSSTLSAILLLIGYEYRVEGSNADNVAVHLKAMEELIHLYNRANMFFCDTMRRALFWQDLSSSLLVGTKRYLSHTSFPELHWMRDPYRQSFYIIPPGFEISHPQMSEDLVEILEDLNALCILLDARCMCGDLPLNAMQIDNAQASIESRLINLLAQSRVSERTQPVHEVCIYAIYACTYKLSTDIWDGSFIPSFCSSKILDLMQKTESRAEWELKPSLLLWILFVGGSFGEKPAIRLQFIALILGTYRERISKLHSTWPEAEQVLRMFVWSNRVMGASFRSFWRELHPS